MKTEKEIKLMLKNIVNFRIKNKMSKEDNLFFMTICDTLLYILNKPLRQDAFNLLNALEKGE